MSRMHDVEFKPPVEERELRQMLTELHVKLDEAVLPRMLAAVQPIRGKLRSESAGQRRALLMGAAITAGWIPPARRHVSTRPSVKPEEPPRPVPTLRHLVARLGTIGLAMFMGTFALMSAGHWGGMAFFAGISGLLLFVGITGWGLGGQEKRQATGTIPSAKVADSSGRRARRIAGAIIGIVLLHVTGILALLVISVRSVFDPRFYAEGDFFSRAFQVVGLIVIFVVVSHVARARRRAAP